MPRLRNLSRGCAIRVVCWALMVGLALPMQQAQEAPVLDASDLPSSEPMIRSSRNLLQVPSPVTTRRVADKPFWTLVAFTAGSAVLDGETTMALLQDKRYQEENPILGLHPGRARFYLTIGATDTAITYVAWRFKRGGHEKLWKVPLLGAATVHLGCGILNLRQ